MMAQVSDRHRLRRRLKDARHLVVAVAPDGGAQAAPEGTAALTVGRLGAATAVPGKVQDLVILADKFSILTARDVSVPESLPELVTRRTRETTTRVDAVVAQALDARDQWCPRT